MGNICCTSEEDENEKDYMFAPKPNQYNGKRNWKKERHGYGTYYYDNGDVYEGNWENDEKHGLGTYHFSTGKILKGYFDKDSYVGAVPIQSSKKNKNKVEQAPAKKIYMDDDGLIVAEARVEPVQQNNRHVDMERNLMAERKRQEIKKEREERHKKTIQKMRQKYNIPERK